PPQRPTRKARSAGSPKPPATRSTPFPPGPCPPAGPEPRVARRHEGATPHMKLAWILWLSSNVLPQPAADSLCLSTTLYLEARDQSVRGQQAVAEVALRRRDSGLGGRNVCQVVTARKQFAPTIVSPQTRLSNTEAWAEAVTVALESEHNWSLPQGQRREIVP